MRTTRLIAPSLPLIIRIPSLPNKHPSIRVEGDMCSVSGRCLAPTSSFANLRKEGESQEGQGPTEFLKPRKGTKVDQRARGSEGEQDVEIETTGNGASGRREGERQKGGGGA